MTDTRQALTDKQLEPVLEAWFETEGTFYERMRAAIAAQPVAGAVAHTSERHFALREAHCIKAQDDYFAARPVEDGAMQRKAFDAGFVRGFDAGEKIYAAPQPQAAPAPEPSAQPVAGAVAEPDCWAILTPNGSKLVSPDEAKGRKDAYPLYAAPQPQAAPAPEPSAQGEPVAWRARVGDLWMHAQDKAGLTEAIRVHFAQEPAAVEPLYASAPSTPPPAVVEAVPSLHPATADLVRRFSQALAEKLAAAEAKYGYSDGWASPDWMDECRTKLMEHIAKGDPRDVAAYCAFLWHHGASTAHAVVEAVPLTDEQMLQCVRSVGGPRLMGLTRDYGPYEVTEPTHYLRELVRAIERAHGIAPKAAQEKT